MSVATRRSPWRMRAEARGAMSGSMAPPCAAAGAVVATSDKRAPSPRRARDRKVTTPSIAESCHDGRLLARGTMPRASEGNVPVLAGRVSVPLGPERPDGVDEAHPSLARVDDVVHIAPRRRGVGVRKAPLVLGREFGQRGRRIL